jgi:hypothetical protein
VRSVVIVVILPLFQLRVEEVNVVPDLIAVRGAGRTPDRRPDGIVRPCRSMWGPRPDVHVLNVAFVDMPVEVGLVRHVSRPLLFFTRQAH